MKKQIRHSADVALTGLSIGVIAIPIDYGPWWCSSYGGRNLGHHRPAVPQ
jgi:hypothetical protein